MISREERQRKLKLAAVREADAQHDQVMTRIAARGGLTLEELRSLNKEPKDEFILKYRDRTDAL